MSYEISTTGVGAAVAVVEWIHSAEESYFLVLKRAQRAGDPWAGQLAFPGGRVEPVDTSLFATCVRETWEECRLALSAAELVRTLPLCYAGRHHGHPVAVQAFYFQIHACPDLILDPTEMEAFYWVRRQDFALPGSHAFRVPLPDMHQEFPGYAVGSQFLWGFTYGVLRDLVGVPEPGAGPGPASAYA